MTLPVRHRPGVLLERTFPAWPEPLVAEFGEMFERMERLMESAAARPSAAGQIAWAPSADLTETDQAYVIEAELPGVRSEDIDVEINEREMRLSGELKEREREGVLRHGTRRIGRFEYRALLPAEVKAEDVSASLSDGVLKVTIPKAEPAKPRHVEVTS